MSLISIVIPTRTRARLLAYAVKSALDQTYRDIEVLICDNDSQDDTPAVAASFRADPRVRYIRTPEPFSMPDNWDFALKQAKGEFVTFLTDDSVLFPQSMECVMGDLLRTGQDVAVWRHAAYYYPDWYETSRRNVLYVPRSAGPSIIVDSEAMLRRLFAMDSATWIDIPKTLNSICRRKVVEAVVARQGRFFPPSCPDYSSAAGVMLNVPSYLLIDKALYVDSVTKESIGASTGYNMGAASQKFLSEFSGGLAEIASLGIPVSPSGVAKSIENVVAAYPERGFKVSSLNLIREIADRLAKVESNGADVDGYWRTMESFTSGDAALSGAMRRTRMMSGLKWRMVAFARGSQALSFLERARGFDVYRGSDEGFQNVEQAGQFAAARLF